MSRPYLKVLPYFTIRIFSKISAKYQFSQKNKQPKQKDKWILKIINIKTKIHTLTDGTSLIKKVIAWKALTDLLNLTA